MEAEAAKGRLVCCLTLPPILKLLFKKGYGKKTFMILSLMGQFIRSLSSLFSTVVCSDLEQTSAETPRYTPCPLSAVICGMDWCGLCCLGQGSCVIQERCISLQKQREAALCPQKWVNQKARWGPAPRTWRTAECRTGRTWEQIVLCFTYEKTEAQGHQGICPHIFRWLILSCIQQWYPSVSCVPGFGLGAGVIKKTSVTQGAGACHKSI